MTDQRLVALLAQISGSSDDGAGEAFSEIDLAHRGRVTRAALRLCGDHMLSDDLAQETMLRAYRRLRSGGFVGRDAPGHEFSAWLLRILRRCWLDELQRLQRRRIREKAWVRREQNRRGEGGTVQSLISEVIARLTPRQQTIAELRYGGAHATLASIARQVGTSPKTVLRELYRVEQVVRSGVC